MSQITVNGHLFDTTGTPLNGATVAFQLVNLAGNIPIVTGTNTVATPLVTTTTNTSGFFTVQIQGNDTISPLGTYYQVTFNGNQTAYYKFTGAGPINLDNPGSALLTTLPPPVGLPTNSILTGNNIFTGNNTFNGTLTAANLDGIIFVEGNVYPRTDIGIQAAINACPAGGTVWLTPGTYIINNTITITQAINLIGSGWGTVLQVASLPSFSGHPVIQITPNGLVSGIRLQDFKMVSAPGNVYASYGIQGSTSPNNFCDLFVIDHLYIPAFGLQSVYLNNSAGEVDGGFFDATIQNCYLSGGILGTAIGDSLNIVRNLIQGPFNGIDVSFTPGSSSLRITDNTINPSAAAIHVGASAIFMLISGNEFETPITATTGSNGAFIDLDGTVTGAGSVISVHKNSFQMVNSCTLNALRINYMAGVHIYDNNFELPTSPGKDIVVTANCTSCFIGYNEFGGASWANIISDSSATGVVLTNVRQAISNYPVVWQDNTGSTVVAGYGTGFVAFGANGANYIYDGSQVGGPGNIAGAFSGSSPAAAVSGYAKFQHVIAQNIENIRFADQFPGADLGAKINAADADLGLKGGEIWVTTAAGTTISTPVNLRNNLRFIQAGSFNVSGQITIAHGGITISGCGLNDIGSNNPGTLLTWSGAAGSPPTSGEMISILGTASNRLDKCVLRDLILDGGNIATYTVRAEKIDSLELHSMRLRNGAIASFYAVDATGTKFFGVSSGVNPSYAVVLDWGTGGFSWYGGAIENDTNSSNPLILLQGTSNNILLAGLELDATTNNTTNFGGFIQINGFDVNSGFAGAPAGGAGAPNNVTIQSCSFFYDGGGVPAAGQGADILVTGTATHPSNSVSVRNCYFAALNVGVYAVKVDWSSNFSIVNTVSNAHTTATTNLTGNSTFNRLEFVTGTDPVSASGAASGSRLEIKQGNGGLFSLPNSFVSSAGILTGDGTVSAPAIAFTNQSNTGLWRSGSGQVDMVIAGNDVASWVSTGAKLSSVGVYGWGSSSSGPSASNADTGLSRDSAGVIDVGNATAADKSGSINLTNLTATGIVKAGDGAFLAPGIAFSSQTNTGLWRVQSAQVAMEVGTTDIFEWDVNGFATGSGHVHGWSSAAGATGNVRDTGLSRDSAGVIDVGNGTAGNKSGTIIAAICEASTNGSAAAPNFTWLNSTNTGMYLLSAVGSPANFGVGFTIGGVLAVSIYDDGVSTPGVILTQPTSSLNVSPNQVGLGNTTATSASAGSNGDVPAQVVGYLVVNIGGTLRKIPYYAI